MTGGPTRFFLWGAWRGLSLQGLTTVVEAAVHPDVGGPRDGVRHRGQGGGGPPEHAGGYRRGGGPGCGATAAVGGDRIHNHFQRADDTAQGGVGCSCAAGRIRAWRVESANSREQGAGLVGYTRTKVMWALRLGLSGLVLLRVPVLFLRVRPGCVCSTCIYRHSRRPRRHPGPQRGDCGAGYSHANFHSRVYTYSRA